MGQKYASFDSTGAIIAFYDSMDSPVPASADVIEITEAQWMECLSHPGYTVANGELVAPAAPTAAQVLATAQANQTALMYQDYQAAVTQDVSFTTAAGVTQTYQTDTGSQQTLLQAYTGFEAAGSVPVGFYWVAADNTQVPFALADLKGLYQEMLAQGWTAFQRLQDRKASIRAAATSAAVQVIVW